MGLEILNELYGEVRRLAIAGAPLARDDFRLRRLLPRLQKALEDLPVLARLAAMTDELVAAPAGETPRRLLELANLLHAVLYTQGETACPGEMAPLRLTPLPRRGGSVSYRKLRPVIEALAGRGSNRLETIRQAEAEGLFADYRLLLPALAALNDSYQELAEAVFAILRGLGPGILPAVRESLDLRGGRGDARKLELISALLGRGGREIYLAALDDGSLPVKIAAVRALKDVPEEKPLLEQLAKDRRKEIREAVAAALRELAPLGRAARSIGGLLRARK
ncbi:MAG: hypothetical protein K6U03_09620 [Firmicutes bacterium]|nr:hypothetical protein [Bacillota bacterium]